MSAKQAPFLRALQVVEAVARAERPIGAAELIHELKLPKPTAHRIVASLERAGLVQRDPVAKRLVAGARLGALALDVLVRSTQNGPRHQILTRLAADTGETASFTVLERDELLVVDRVESAWPLRINLFPGSRVPLHCTASGKLMLALLPERLRDQMLRRMLPLRAFTPGTITEPKELAAALARIRSGQVSMDREEFMAGMVAIAVPVTNPRDGRPVGTVSLNAPAARLKLDRARRYLPALRRAAGALSQSFDNAPPVPPASRTVRGR